MTQPRDSERDCLPNPIVRNLNTNASIFGIAKQRDCVYSRETHRHMKHWGREEHKHPSTALECHTVSWHWPASFVLKSLPGLRAGALKSTKRQTRSYLTRKKGNKLDHILYLA